MDRLTRDDTIALLFSMGVEIPPDSRLSREALDKRLKQAINNAQRLADCLPSSPINPAALSQWPAQGPGNRSAYEASRRGNLFEAMAGVGARMQGRDHPLDLNVNPFMDLRQTLMALTKFWDEGRTWGVIQDAEKTSGISFRVISIHEIDPQTPFMVIAYRSTTSDNAAKAIPWIEAQLAKDGSSLGLLSITSSKLEQKFLLKLLALNSKLLLPGYKPRREATESEFKISCLLPIGPLFFEDIGKLNLDPGCSMCGKQPSSKCSKCQTVNYCSPACQEADWASHKLACRPLEDGTWRAIPITSLARLGLHASSINRFDKRRNRAIGPEDAHTPPPNKHGAREFLIKIQSGGATMPMMIYDRQGSLKVLFSATDDPGVFREIQAEMSGPRGGYAGMKMYRWAKRTGDWELSVCLDRAPETGTKW